MRVRMRKVKVFPSLAAVCVAMIAMPAAAQDTAATPLTETPSTAPDVTSMSVEIGGRTFSLPAPTLHPGMTAEEQHAALKEPTGKYDWARLTRDSIVAPFVFKKETFEDAAAQRAGYRLDLWFVAHGTLEKVEARNLFRNMAGAGGQDGAATPLTPEQLTAREIQLPVGDNLSSQLARFSLPIMDRVQISGVALAQRYRQVEDGQPVSLLGTLRIDPRFNEDADWPNRWWSLGEDASPERSPYAGFIGYAQAVPLREPAGALLIECHAILEEPRGWFDGKSLLSSKLPLIVQDNVRSFRRALSKAE